MTNTNDEDIDLGLALGCTTLNVQTKPENDSGAGVNASTMVDMAFAASDPLSELVWSPHKGLSLKCADSSLADKRPFLLWNMGPSNLIASPSQGDIFKGIYDENAINEKIIVSQERFLANVMGSKSGNHIGCSGEVKIMNTADTFDTLDANQDEEKLKNTEKGFCITQDIQITQTVESCGNHAGQGDSRTERSLLRGACSKLDMETTEPLSGKCNQEISTNDKGRGEDVQGSDQALIPTVKDSEAAACLLPNAPTKKDADKTLESTSLQALEKVKLEECIAENDVNLPGVVDTCGQNDEELVRYSSVPPETSPTNSRSSSYRRKGKGKAISEENVSRKMSNNEEDSHESVESCNATGLVPKGKKRWHFEQQHFLVGSKRIRKHTDGDPATESAIARNSSFMSWISNMVRGFPKTNLEGSPTLALPFTSNNEENHGKETNHQEIVMYDKDHDSSSRPMGFQNVFQSLYRPTSKVAEAELPKEDHPMGESKKLPSADKSLIYVPPISCHRGDDMSDAHMLMSNDKIDISKVAHLEVPPMKTQIVPPVVLLQEASRTTSAENKSSTGMARGKAKAGEGSPDSISRLRTSIGEDINTCNSSEYDASNINQSLLSLWITRFSSKTLGTVSNIDNAKPATDETLTCSTEGRRNPLAQTSVECQIERESSDAKETSAGEQDGDVAASSKDIHDNNSERSMNNLHPIIPSAKFKKSEALASLFSRRLDALKHIAPSSTRTEYSYTRTTCFFCGIRDHDLRNCPEVTESELEVLIRNIRSYNGAEDSSCLCIRCFQLDHWAISCPTSSSNMSQQLGHNKSVANQNRNDDLRPFTSNEHLPSLLEIKQGHSIGLANHSHCSRDKSSSDLMHNRKQFGFARTFGPNQVQKQGTADHVESSLKGNIISSNLVSKEIPYVPKGTFDMIRGLRLSRAEILRWMNSNASLSHLDGLFLRLRLGKWEAGLGGTGYYVACITGLKGEKLESISKNCIYVNVCGVKCFVGSQYVSNQDFLEDELTTWWRKTLESGGKVPAEADLRIKLEERMKLGF